MSAPLRVGFTGYYGMRNFGDDLFGVLCAAAARRYWNAEPTLVGPTLQEAQARGTWPTRLPANWYGSTGSVGKAARLFGFARGLHASDVLVMGGGSVLNARESFRKPMMLSARRRGRVELAAVGVSVGPFPDAAAEASVARFVRQFSYLSVRDRRSYDLAQRMGLSPILHAGRDLAGLLRTLYPMPAAAPRARSTLHIGLAPCRYTVRADHPAPTPAQWQAAAVSALANQAADRPVHVTVFSLNGHPQHGDDALSAELEQQLRQAGVSVELRRYGGNPLATVREIHSCDAFVSARLHGAIVAYLCDVPFAIVDYHPKCRDFADDVGLPDALRIDAGSHDAAALARALQLMLNDGGARAPLSPDVYAQEAPAIFKCAPWSNPFPARQAV
jgi:polysaccharide pyruvyl transferase WcaK-like protein